MPLMQIIYNNYRHYISILQSMFGPSKEWRENAESSGQTCFCILVQLHQKATKLIMNYTLQYDFMVAQPHEITWIHPSPRLLCWAKLVSSICFIPFFYVMIYWVWHTSMLKLQNKKFSFMKQGKVCKSVWCNLCHSLN